jgi:ATP phosphoribosyltransferase
MSDRSDPDPGARMLRVGLPKGSLQDTTQKLFSLAGYDVRIPDRSYYPRIDDPEMECILIRPQEMARYVEQGVMDCGIAGLDWIRENEADVVELADLRAPWPQFGPVRWVLAVKEGSEFSKPEDLNGKRIATEAMGLTRRYFEERGISAQLEFSWGATEVKPPILADAIVDVTETGSSLRANDLQVIDVVLESTPRLVANRQSLEDDWKKAKLDCLVLLLTGAIAAASRVGLVMNVPKTSLDDVLALLPALTSPTISTLADEGWLSLTSVIEEKLVRELIPRLVEAGARGIIEFPLHKIID